MGRDWQLTGGEGAVQYCGEDDSHLLDVIQTFLPLPFCPRQDGCYWSIPACARQPWTQTIFNDRRNNWKSCFPGVYKIKQKQLKSKGNEETSKTRITIKIKMPRVWER